MKVEKKPKPPEKWYSSFDKAEKYKYTFKITDDQLKYHNILQYDRRWQTRCDNCLSVCCFMSITGFRYDYLDDSSEEKVVDMRRFWTNEFVIMNIKDNTWKKNAKMGFNITLNPEELKSNGLQVCPLSVLGKCMIYEDRPKMCREWRCSMAMDKYLGTK